MDGVAGADLGTFHAADAAIFADCSGLVALGGVAAGHKGKGGFRQHIDEAVGALLGAGATPGAVLLVDDSNAVCKLDGVELTDL